MNIWDLIRSHELTNGIMPTIVQVELMLTLDEIDDSGQRPGRYIAYVQGYNLLVVPFV